MRKRRLREQVNRNGLEQSRGNQHQVCSPRKTAVLDFLNRPSRVVVRHYVPSATPNHTIVCIGEEGYLVLQEDQAPSQQSASSSQGSTKPVVYGELVILGYNGCLPQGERGRRRSKYTLTAREWPNGIKKSRHYVVDTPSTSKAVQNANIHSISYTLSRNQAVIVEYEHDPETDLFQKAERHLVEQKSTKH
ncbi:PELI1 [Cordylochernes scorpioides]|uniref:PELI1 n=1 Tax=Cordylochernes scorpioides TaxID=51811 RepID=A0ABY6L1Q1_9ARAC|nr:PELI1 [Cordylochernes scorpioides]